MKVISLYLDHVHLEFHNSVLGKETVYVNGQEVSSKISVLGTTHRFSVYENGQWVAYEMVSSASTWGIAVDIYRDGRPLLITSQNRPAPPAPPPASASADPDEDIYV